MDNRGAVRLLIAGIALALVASAAARAATPWGGLFDTRRVEADPNKPYSLKEANGPWMVMACSFSGPNAEKQAHDLVIELRQKYKLEAFSYQKEFKLDSLNADQDDGPAGAARRRRYKKFKDTPKIEEFAVLVGNYPAIDDDAAQKTLQKLKYADPDCLKPSESKPTSQTLASMRAIQRDIQKAILPNGDEKKNRGPMGHAFVTTNPMLPADYYAPKKGIDELVLRMNKDVTHSLLDCPAQYTVQVAHFTGNVIINQREIQAIENGKEVASSLADAANKAHELTEALRMKGWEAYEFHDRYASIVTVGSFNSVGTPRPDGKTEINPQVHAIMKTFGAEKLPTGQYSPRSLAGIFMDVQPIPVEVPKRSISRELARGL